jgi:RNA polymerase sigma-70 factor (ECF subfamily)
MVEHDTAIRAGQSQFPPTAWSLLSRLKDPRDPQVRAYLDRMIQSYWRPVYKFIRVGWKRSNEDAKDLAQAFFVHLLEGDLLARAQADRGNFRKLLLAALRNFLSNDLRAKQAVKRGGGRLVLSLDQWDDSEGDHEPADPQSSLESEWGRELLGRSIERLRSRARPEVWTAFQRFHLDDVPVREVAREMNATEARVGHYLQDARSLLRRLVTDEIREYVGDESEVARELDALFGGWR